MNVAYAPEMQTLPPMEVIVLPATKSTIQEIYTHFDKHMERVMILEFYRRIIQEYFKTQ